jgi:hypothetical protein
MTININAMLHHYIDADIPVFIAGAPGIGKSDIVKQVAGERGLPLIDVRALLLEAIDLRGLPFIDNGIAVWSKPDFLPRLDRDGNDGVLFLDELNAASQSVQAACYQLVLNRRVGEYELPSGWRIIAAGNRAKDKAAAQAMPTPLANRFAHITLEPDLDAWLAWAFRSGINAMISAFLRARPNLLHVMPKNGELAFPTPRSWAQVHKVLSAPEALRGSLISGLVGEGAGLEFMAFAKTLEDLIDYETVIADPLGAKIPAKLNNTYAVVKMLISSMRADTMRSKNLKAVEVYVNRLPPDYAAMFNSEMASINAETLGLDELDESWVVNAGIQSREQGLAKSATQHQTRMHRSRGIQDLVHTYTHKGGLKTALADDLTKLARLADAKLKKDGF